MLSVLMSVYHKENPLHLAESLDSVLNQTLSPDEIVMVKDGPLTPALDAVLDEYVRKHPLIKRVALPVNVGLGRALNEGLKHCSGELVARMDTDDISKPGRFARQSKILRDNPDIDIVGSWVEEFDSGMNDVVSVRKVPETPERICAYAKKRSPFNHPTVMLRKEAVLSAGGYRHFLWFEDYCLWAHMLNEGRKGYNIQESLLFFRTSPDMFRRRGGMKYLKNEIALQREFRRIGFISGAEMALNIAVRSAFRLIPNGTRAFMYKTLLRKS